jgi:hypothetical protein
MKLRLITFGLVTLLAAVGAIAATDDETEAFIREIIKNARTNSERSSLLMEAVPAAEGNTKLKIALLEKSVQYGIKGLKTIDDCRKFQTIIASLLTADPDRKALWLSLQADLFRRWFILAQSPSDKQKLAEAAVEALALAGSASCAKGDWKEAGVLFNKAKLTMLSGKVPNPNRMSGYIRTASHLYRTQTKIADDIATLKKTPDDLDARSALIKNFITAMDDPAEALKYVNEDSDERYQTFVPMAAGDISKLPADACKNLGDWYSRELSKSVVPIVKFRMLARAKIYYDRVLKQDSRSDVMSAALKLSMSRIKSEQAKLGNVDPLRCMYCSSSGAMPCPSCQTKGESTGLRRCFFCKGLGRMKCTGCAGLWRLKCPRCKGRGKVVTGTRRSGGAYHKVYGKCGTCAGRGVTHRSQSRYAARPGSCGVCSKLTPESLRGTGLCTYCDGQGGTGTCYGCKGAKVITCTRCVPGYVISPFRTARSSIADPSRPARRPRRKKSKSPVGKPIPEYLN